MAWIIGSRGSAAFRTLSLRPRGRKASWMSDSINIWASAYGSREESRKQLIIDLDGVGTVLFLNEDGVFRPSGIKIVESGGFGKWEK